MGHTVIIKTTGQTFNHVSDATLEVMIRTFGLNCLEISR